MPYIGNIPAEKYAAFNVQYFTTSATATYTLDRAVANELDIRLVINNVIQEPGSGKAYTAAGTTLTLSAATAGSDTMYAVYIGKAVQTVNPGAGSVGTTALADNAVTLGKMASGTDGNIISYDASGNPVAVATGSSGQVLTSAGAGAPPTFAAASGTTINNNADNRVITGSGTANTLEGEANLTYSSPDLTVTGGNPSIIHNNTTAGGTSGIKFQGSGTDYAFSRLNNSAGNLEIGTVPAWSTRFYTNNTERVTIHGSGGVISAANGIALGVGTANTASNVLDDYEVGEMASPIYIDNQQQTSYTSGRDKFSYIKIGRLVQCFGYVDTASQTLVDTGAVELALPFPVAAASSNALNTGVAFLNGYLNNKYWATHIYLNADDTKSEINYAVGTSSENSAYYEGGAFSVLNTSHRLILTMSFTYNTDA